MDIVITTEQKTSARGFIIHSRSGDVLLVRDNHCLFMHPCVALDLNEHTGAKCFDHFILHLWYLKRVCSAALWL